jgi:hypothetical protein
MIINPSQSGFIPSRLIRDDAIIAFEAFHTQNKIKKKKLFVGIKLAWKKPMTSRRCALVEASLQRQDKSFKDE